MNKYFIYKVNILCISGNGGNGGVYFIKKNRNKIAMGGNGGNGGNIYIVGSKIMNSLYIYKKNKTFKANNGENGKRNKKNGKNAKDIIIYVPFNSKVICKNIYNNHKHTFNINNNNKLYKLLSGGIGGRGNWCFRRKNIYNYEKGSDGSECKVTIINNCNVDICIIGMANSGKSTLLSKLTNANPKINVYPYTTTIPNFGILKLLNVKYIISELPGICINSKKNIIKKSLKYLRYINNCKLILLVISYNINWIKDFCIILNTLIKINNNFLFKNLSIILNCYNNDINKYEIKNKLSIFNISLKNDNNLNILKIFIYNKLKKIKDYLEY